MDEAYERRIARNESRFRELNGHLADNVEEFREGLGTSTFAVMCECAITECDEMK